MNMHRRRANAYQPRHKHQRVVEFRRATKFDRHVGHRIGTLPGFHHSALVDPDQSHHVGPGALHVAQVIGVIDHAHLIGLLEKDAHRESVLASVEASFDRLVDTDCRHNTTLYRTRPPRQTQLVPAFALDGAASGAKPSAE